ncbi:MAG: type II toxin-antitoxin system RelE/ParE family toxin [Rectinemataceae bacterium]|nr:type II toxin-antitoxin system RelE/ParE family toxin [Rectinemataceae bacterium]
MKTFKIVFHPEARKELLNLDGSVRILVLKQIKKLEQFPQLGELLGNRHGYDLTNYRKLYCSNKNIRLVYSIVEDHIIVKIIAIGKRKDFEVYKNAHERID